MTFKMQYKILIMLLLILLDIVILIKISDTFGMGSMIYELGCIIVIYLLIVLNYNITKKLFKITNNQTTNEKN
jgi:hypothetical protein